MEPRHVPGLFLRHTGDHLHIMAFKQTMHRCWEGRRVCSLRVVLGWQELLETDEAARPLIEQVCHAIDLKTHWDASDMTLYIASPAQGRVAAVSPASDLTGSDWQRAKRIVVAAKARLAGAGSPGAARISPDAIIHVEVQSKGPPGISVSFSWRSWSHNRRLAALLMAEVADAAGVPPLGTRVSSALQPQVCIGITGGPAIGQEEGVWCTEVGAAIYRGLCRFWALPGLGKVSVTGRRTAPVRVPMVPVEAPPVAVTEQVHDKLAGIHEESMVHEVCYQEPVGCEPMIYEEPIVYIDPDDQEEPVVCEEPRIPEEPVVCEEPPIHDEGVVCEEPQIDEEPGVWVVEAERVLILDPVPASGVDLSPPQPALAAGHARHAKKTRVPDKAPAAVPLPLTILIPEQADIPAEFAPLPVLEMPPVLIPEPPAADPEPLPATDSLATAPAPQRPGHSSRVSAFQWQRSDKVRAAVLLSQKATRTAPFTAVTLFEHTQKAGYLLSRTRR